MKRLLLMLTLAICVILCIKMPAMAAEQADVTVYVDSVNGKTGNDGLTESTAVSTIKEGFATLMTAMTQKGLETDPNAEGRIVIVNDYRYEEFTTSGYKKDIASASHKYHVTITGKTADTSLQFYLPTQCYYGLRGPTTFENINICITEDSKVAFLSIHGREGKLTIGEGVTTSDEPDRRPSLSAGPYFNASADMYLEVNSGHWRNLYAGSYINTVNGKANLVMNGGYCLKLGTSYNGTQNADVSITVNGGTVAELQGGAINTAKINGNIDIRINGGTFTGTFNPQGNTTPTGTVTTTVAPIGTVTFKNTGEVTVTNVTAGTVVLDNARLTITDSVTGPVSITIPGGVSYGTYITAPSATADNAFVFTGTTLSVTTSGTNKLWQCTDPALIKGLVLQVPSGVTCNLYTGIAKGVTTKITPDITETANGIKSQTYLNLPVGSYHYVSSGTGYFTVDKDILFTEAKAAIKTVINADPGKKSGNKYEETGTIYIPTDEFMEKVIPSDVALWADYLEALTTPVFTDATRATHQYTTYSELIAVLEELDASNENMYLYYLGKSHTYDIDIPLVIFTRTDLSQAETLEEAAKLVVANEKLTVHYQGLMHGNEPAGGEGALAVTKLLAGDYGDGLTDTMNIYVIPWLSPAGARDSRRMIPGTNIDPNRDMLRVETSEIQLHHYAYELFQPEVSMDSHEFTVDPSYETTGYNDMMLAAGFTANNSEQFRALSAHLTTLPFEKLEEQGLRYSYYLNEVNFNNPNNGSSYAGNRGMLYVLIESRGIFGGNAAFARRVVGHVITATEVLNYVHENVEAVQAVVDAEKAMFAATGATYEESDMIVLEHGSVEHPELSIVAPRYNGATGEWKYDTTIVAKILENPTRSRVKPTAYVIPAGESWTQSVLDRLDKHFIEYTFIPAGQSILLQQYGGTTSQATLSAEQFFTFENGAYVITMDTYYSVVIATMFEPDITDSIEYAGTLVQSGLIPAVGNSYPLYRYIRDLNDDGSITTYTPSAAPTEAKAVAPAYVGGYGSIVGLKAERSYEYRSAADTQYTAVAAGATTVTDLSVGTYYLRYQATDGAPSADAVLTISYEGLTEFVVYLDSAAGSDDNTGYQEAAPVATMSKAFSQLDALISTAEEGTSGKIVLLSDYALGATAYTFPKHTYHVTLTAADQNTKLTKGGTTNQNVCSVNLSGPMTIDHITLAVVSNSAYNNFNANGHKVVIGSDIKCVANSKGAYFMLAAGGWSDVASTDLTVNGGNWEYIYAGGYTGSVSGEAKLTVRNATVRQQMMATYNAANTGTHISMTLENVTAPILYCGMAKNRDSGSNINGNITLTLGKNVNIPTIYAGSRDSGNVAGVVTLVQAGADMSAITVYPKNKTSGTFGGCILSNADGSYLKLLSNVTGAYTLKGNVLLDLAGFTMTNATVEGLLMGMDSTTDGYTGTNAGSLSCTVADGGKILSHCATAISGATKRYMAVSNEDGSYGFHRFYLGITHMSLKTTTTGVGYKAVFYGDAAVAANLDSFGFTMCLEGNEPVTAALSGDKFESGKVIALRIDNFDVERYGETALSASVMLKLADGTYIESSTCTMTMRGLVEQLNDSYTAFTADQLTAVGEMIKKYTVIQSWKVENLI